jgi:hypothetical protein
VVRVRPVVGADETRLRIVRDKSGETENGFGCTFGARDDSGGLAVAHVLAEDRSGSTPKTLLEGTTGVLLVDGYSGYNIVDEVSTRRRAACHAHLRRYFHEALLTAPVEQEMVGRAVIRGPSVPDYKSLKRLPAGRACRLGTEVRLPESSLFVHTLFYCYPQVIPVGRPEYRIDGDDVGPHIFRNVCAPRQYASDLIHKRSEHPVN